LAKKTARKARKAQEAATTTKEEAEVAAQNSTDPCEAPIDVPRSDADAGLAMPYVADDAILANESTEEPSSAKEEPFQSHFRKEGSDSGSASTDEAAHQVSGRRLQRQTSRWADDESGEEWELDEEERQQLLQDLDEEERCRLLGQFPDTTDEECSDWDGAWTEDEDEEIAAVRMPGVDSSVRIEPGLESEKGPQAYGSFPAPHSKSKRRSRNRRRNNGKKRQVNDDWMTPWIPFPQLRLAPVGPAVEATPWTPLVFQTVDHQPLLPQGQPLPSPMQPLLPPVVSPSSGQPMVAPSMKPVLPNVNPTGPAVCIWNTTSPSAATACVDGTQQDVFTDGSQVFQPVPSTNGQPLFTDGKQLYASVCVMYTAPPSSEGEVPPLPEPSPEPGSMMDCCETVDEHSVANLISYMATSDEDGWD